ncbi:YdcF family protein [Wenzhouxiangella sediminis]|uniref:YdcF family protein n=1 Tax=Wenzhouxiangella sediminis TaxID=1792836 RepID=A0A3E1KB65_9GAMM|nr:ElyC/SanA/YdcF family protein [Wenzhouxiangella sediminis]MEE4303032.1 ElyC/SanA/YdcF family protein [Wenzhouxiangella sp.]RFF31577.1 YdcF family protein [Wenzhouxiangella sediminis]
MNVLHSPLFLALVAATLAMLAARFSRRLLFATALGFMLLFLGLTTPLGANLLVRMVEATPPHGTTEMQEACPDSRTLVFLSGGVRRPAADTGDFGALTAETIDRVLTLQADSLPADWTLVISGGGPFRVPEAAIIAALMRSLDIEPARMLVESSSTSTRTGAAEVAELLLPEAPRIVLATSALHLPRASWTFRKAGFEVCPWPLNSRYVPVRSVTGLLPQSTALDKSERALYELLGQLYYRLTLWQE